MGWGRAMEGESTALQLVCFYRGSFEFIVFIPCTDTDTTQHNTYVPLLFIMLYFKQIISQSVCVYYVPSMNREIR